MGQPELKTNLYKKLSELASSEILGNSGSTELIDPDRHLVNDVGFDDLDEIEFIMYIEEELGIEIPDTDGVNLKTLRDFHDYLVKRGVDPDKC